MTYGDLDRRSDKLAVELQRRGAKANMFIGLLMGDKSFDLCVGVLGILKSGAAYVPMDPVRFPKERIKFMMEDANMTMFVTVRAHMSVVDGLGINREDIAEIYIDDCDDLVSYNSPVRSSAATDYAYMIYTSGTTGKPKGVICNHVGPVNMIASIWFSSHFEPQLFIVGFSFPFIFDPFVKCFLVALIIK